MKQIRILLKYLYVLCTHFCVVCWCGKIRRGKEVSLLRLDALGDFILWLDSAKEYKNIYPGRRIILLVNEAWLELAQALPYWDEVWGVDVRKFRYHFFYRTGLLARLRQRGFEYIVQPRYSREFMLEDSMVLSSGAAQRITFEGDLANIQVQEKKWSDRWYTRLIPNPPSSWGELKRNAGFIRELGLKFFKAGVPQLEAFISNQPALAQDAYYVLSPGAGRNLRRWPLENFARIADQIYQATGMKGIICGTASEKDLAVGLIRLSKAPLIDMTAKTSIVGLIRTIKNADFVLSNETAAVHIAAAVNTKSICILGGGHFGRFIPYQVENEHAGPLPQAVYYEMDCYHCDWSCKFSVGPGDPVPCINHVKSERVWQAIGRLNDRTIRS